MTSKLSSLHQIKLMGFIVENISDGYFKRLVFFLYVQATSIHYIPSIKHTKTGVKTI